jgi:hypothetical protein
VSSPRKRASRLKAEQALETLRQKLILSETQCNLWRTGAELIDAQLKQRTIEAIALRDEVKSLLQQHQRLYNVANCGSVDSFLQCDDDVKRGYFAMMIHESSENKKLHAEIEELKERIIG